MPPIWRGGQARGWAASLLPPIAVLLIISAALEAYVRIAHLPQYVLPRPTAVLAAMSDHAADLLESLWATTRAAVIGFAASTCFGILAAIGLASSKWARRAFYPYTVFFQTVPIVAIAPMLVIWLDPGLKSVATSAFIVSVFPVIANALSGLLSTDPALIDLFRLYGAGRTATLLKLRLPSALPNIVTGLRVAGGLAVIGTVVGEFLVGTYGPEAGLGVRIVSASHNGHTDVVFAAVLIASLLGLAIVGAVNVVGHLMLRRWHASEKP